MLAAWIELEGRHRPGRLGSQTGHQVVEEGAHSHDVGDDHKAPPRGTRRGVDQFGGCARGQFDAHGAFLAGATHRQQIHGGHRLDQGRRTDQFDAVGWILRGRRDDSPMKAEADRL